MEAEYASKGIAGTGLGFGIAGTTLGLLNGGLGLMGNNVANGRSGGPVTQEQMRDMRKISELQASLALADAKFANEVSENTKVSDVYKALAVRDREVEGRVTKLESDIASDRAAFAEYRSSQAEIQRLRDENTKLYIDNKVCPVNGKADMALAYINKISAIGVLNTQVFTPPTP